VRSQSVRSAIPDHQKAGFCLRADVEGTTAPGESLRGLERAFCFGGVLAV